MTVVEMYVDMIHKGIKTFDDVPERIKEQVKELLEKNETTGNA